MHFSNALLLGIAVYALRLDVKVKPYLETNSLLSALNLLTQLNLRAGLIPSAIVCGGARATPSTGTAVIVFTARQGHIPTTHLNNDTAQTSWSMSSAADEQAVSYKLLHCVLSVCNDKRAPCSHTFSA